MSDNVVDLTRDALLDVVTPLLSQGITSITVKQVIDQIKTNPDLQGITITDDLISQAVQGITGLSIAPDMANGGKLAITLNPSAPSTQAAQQQTDKAADKIDQAATRQSTKDLGT